MTAEARGRAAEELLSKLSHFYYWNGPTYEQRREIIERAFKQQRAAVWEEAARLADDFDVLTCDDLEAKYGTKLDVSNPDHGHNVALFLREQREKELE